MNLFKDNELCDNRDWLFTEKEQATGNDHELPGFVVVSGATESRYASLDEAINAAHLNDTIRIPVGRFQLASKLIVDKPLTLEGTSPTESILFGSFSDSLLDATFDGDDPFIMRNLGLQWCGEPATTEMWEYGTFTKRGPLHEIISDPHGIIELNGKSRIEHCIFSSVVNVYATGEWCASSAINIHSEATITHCKMDQVHVGIHFKPECYSTEINIEHNEIEANWHGIIVDGKLPVHLDQFGEHRYKDEYRMMLLTEKWRERDNEPFIVIQYNKVKGKHYGFLIDQGFVKLYENVCYDCILGIQVRPWIAEISSNNCTENCYGISVEQDVPSYDNDDVVTTERLLISGNRVIGSKENGIELKNLSTATLDQNVVDCSAKIAILLDHSTCEVKSNRIEANQNGIVAIASSGEISSNRCTKNIENGIQIDQESRFTVTDNTCIENSIGILITSSDHALFQESDSPVKRVNHCYGNSVQDVMDQGW